MLGQVSVKPKLRSNKTVLHPEKNSLTGYIYRRHTGIPGRKPAYFFKKRMGFQRSGCSKVLQPVQVYNYSRVDVESEVDRSN